MFGLALKAFSISELSTGDWNSSHHSKQRSLPAMRRWVSPPWTSADALASGRGAGAYPASVGACGARQRGPTAQPTVAAKVAASKTPTDERTADIQRLRRETSSGQAAPTLEDAGRI